MAGRRRRGRGLARLAAALQTATLPCRSAREAFAGGCPRSPRPGPFSSPVAPTPPSPSRFVDAPAGPDDLLPGSPRAGGRLGELFFRDHPRGADVADLLDRRTRIGLVAADRALAVPCGGAALRTGTEYPVNWETDASWPLQWLRSAGTPVNGGIPATSPMSFRRPRSNRFSDLARINRAGMGITVTEQATAGEEFR